MAARPEWNRGLACTRAIPKAKSAFRQDSVAAVSDGHLAHRQRKVRPHSARGEDRRADSNEGVRARLLGLDRRSARGAVALAGMARNSSNRGNRAQQSHSFVQDAVQSPAVLDAENELLKRRVWSLYIGLLLSSTFTLDRPPILLSGARQDGELDIRDQTLLELSASSLIRPYASVNPAMVEQAARFAQLYEQLVASPPPRGPWRFFRAATVYVEARQTREVLDRLHQFCRCIDGLILSEPGKGAKQFKSRTELFIGPGHHELMGELYAIRSDIEHLHEHKYLEIFDRPARLNLAEKAAIAEHIARHALGHILSAPALWSHFGNSTNLASFWQLSSNDRQNLWGPPMISLADALSEYDPLSISDFDLGKRR